MGNIAEGNKYQQGKETIINEKIQNKLCHIIPYNIIDTIQYPSIPYNDVQYCAQGCRICGSVGALLPGTFSIKILKVPGKVRK